MNKDNAKDFLPLVQALADGKTLQIRDMVDDGWADMTTEVGFSMPPDSYRIKPAPTFLYVIMYRSSGMTLPEMWGAYPNYTEVKAAHQLATVTKVVTKDCLLTLHKYEEVK